MNNVATELDFIETCYNDAETLESALWDNTEDILAGVQFSDDLAGRNNIDADLEIVLR